MKTNRLYRLFLALFFLTAAAAHAQFDFVTNNDTITITGYTGPAGAVTIPSTLGGLPVTAIQGSGFADKGITSVAIPNSVTNIQVQVFAFNDALKSFTVDTNNPAYSSAGGVLFTKSGTTLLDYPQGGSGIYAIPNGVMTIETNAFFLCVGLTGVTFPASVTSLDDGAFGDCDGLTNLTLGAGVSYISTSAFGGCDELTTINVNPANPNFSSLNGVVFTKSQTTLIRFPPGFTRGYTTPTSVTNIAAYAFEDSVLTDVTISSNVTSIGLDSFQGCGSLTNVTMLGGVVSIGIFAFADSSKLATVTLPATVAEIAFGAFAYDALNAVYFEGNEPTTDPSAFLGESATVYFLPGTSGWGPTLDGLTTVLEGAPSPNGALEVTILPPGAVAGGAQWQVDGGLLQPAGATVVGLSVGPHTVSFTTVTDWTAPSNEMVSVNANVTNAASGTYTPEAAPASDFTFTTNAGTITITGYTGPGGPVNIPSTINSLPVTGIGNQAFSASSTVTSVTIPDSVTNLGQYAFNSCSALAEVTISENVSNIPPGLFEDCFSLSEVMFRGAVTSIGDDAFASCPDLTSLAIPDTVTNLGEYAFFGDGLTNVTIPASLTSIGEAAFLYCYSLPAINVDPANPAYASVGGVLFNKSQTLLVEYPDGKIGTSYAISNSVTSIGDAAFQDCLLSSISIPASVTIIGNYTFEACQSLAAVTIPGSVTTIGEEAFALCNALTGIVLPASVTNLGDVPFADCNNMTAITVAAGNPAFSSVNGVLYNKAGTLLVEYPCGLSGSFTVAQGVQDIGSEAFEQCPVTSVTIPASVTNIEFSAFFNCLDLGSVTIADGLTAIGTAAFDSCYALTNVVLPASLTSIGSSAFGYCPLYSIVVPSAVQSVGDYAFAFCANLTAAYFEGNAPPDDSTVFVSDGNATVYYLSGATGWGATFGTAPTKVLPAIAITAHPASGKVPLPVSFTAAAVDSETDPVVNWNWSFGDGATSAAQDPSHTYAAFGHFAAAVVETNGAGLPVAGAAITIAVVAVPVFSGLVENGGFETADFTGWDLFGGDTPDNFVTNTVNGVFPHSGDYFALLGSFGTNLSYLSQTLATTAGQPYVLSLWLNSPDGFSPNQFLVSWNGTTLFNQTNLPETGWTNLQFVVPATGTNTVLEFGFRDDPSFLGLDDVSVFPEQPGVAGLSVSGANLILDCIHGQSGNAYIVLTSTNLALPLSRWTPAATNLLSASGNFSITVTNTVSAEIPQRYYVLQTQ
jgi:hypothetical protein